MSLSKRRDFGVRVAGDKGRLPDEFVTKRQIVQGQNITVTHLPNFDIMISAFNSSGGSSGNTGIGDGYEKIRDLYVEIKLVRPFINYKTHFDINDDASNSDANQKFFGTHVFAEIRHNWGLVKPDMFQYSFLDTRNGVEPIPKNSVNSFPRIVGINGNKIRIIGTDADIATRINPIFWVDLDESGATPKMRDTRFLHFDGTTDSVPEITGDFTNNTPTYRIRLTEVRDYEFSRIAAKSDGVTYEHDTTYGA